MAARRRLPRPAPPPLTALNALSESEQRAIYAALVAELANAKTRVAARFAVAKRFTITVVKVEVVEMEGRRLGWPRG